MYDRYKLTGSHLVNKFDPGTNILNTLSPTPGTMASAITSVVNTEMVHPNMAGNEILLARNTLLSKICNTVKKVAPTSSLVLGISTLAVASPPR